MTIEFSKKQNKTETVYTLESATGGGTGTSAGNFASVNMPMGGVRKRGDNLIAQEADKKEVVPSSKPRNFVAKNATTGGAGAHVDKKRAQKQGKEKHKKPFAESADEYTTEKQIETRIRQIMYDRKLSGTDSNAGELTRLKARLKDLRGQQGVAEGTADDMNKMFGNMYDPMTTNLQRVALLAMQGRQNEAMMQLNRAIKDASSESQKKIIDAINNIKPVTINGKVADSATLDKSPKHQEWILKTFIPWVQKTIGQQSVAEGMAQLSVQQLATVSDQALDNAYHYGRSTPGNTFGWQANLKSAEFAKRMIDAGETDIEKISDAIHQGWNVTARAFVKNPDQFDDTEKLRAAGKLDAKLQQREKLMNVGYGQLPDDEQEKDRVVARALLQAIKGDQDVAEGSNSSPFNQEQNLRNKSDKELAELIQFWNRALEKNPEHKIAREQLGLIKMIRSERIGKKLSEKTASKDVTEMDNRTPSGDRREQRAYSPEAIAQREKEIQSQLQKLKKVNPELRKKLGLPDLPEPKEGVSEDHEIQMASSELQSIAKNAVNLLDLVRKYSEREGLQAWQQSKITRAADYLNAVLQSISGEQHDPTMAENFKDGRHPGRKGLAKRSGVDTGASVSSLRDTAKHSTGEKQRMAHWLANMKSGHAKDESMAEGSTQKYEMMLRNGQVKKFVAKDDADARRIAAGHSAKSVIRMKGNVPGDKIGEQGVAENAGRELTNTPRDRLISRMSPSIDNNALLQKVGKVVNSPEFNSDTILKIVDSPNITHPVGRYIQKEFDELQYDLGRAYEDHPEEVAEKLLSMLQDRTQQGVAEAAKHGLYYNVNKRKAAGTSRPASSPKAPTAQAWKDAAKTAKKEGVAEGESTRCKQCGMKNCKCPGGSCKCKPIAGWIPGKGFQKAMDEAAPKNMSRAAKGYEKYGKKGMQSLSKAGREGASEKKLDAIRDKYDNYNEEWSKKYKSSINCSHPKGFSQRAHCAGKKKHNESMLTMEMVCADCGMCETHGNHMMEIKQRLDAKCWSGKHKEGTKIKGGVRVNNCVPNESSDAYSQRLQATLENVLAEKIPANAPVDVYIKDFEKSNAPQFRGKTKEKRRQMAVAASYAAKNPSKKK